MFVVWKQFTAALSGASVKTVRCEKCRGEYHYECVRRGRKRAATCDDTEARHKERG